jgi:HlyD family secretion protein
MVVTYTVVVAADNPDGKLLPYMTASVKFEVDNLTNILKVPNSALRWKPKPSQIAPDAAKKAPNKSDANSPDNKKEPSFLWIEDGDYVRPIEVTVGPNDGAYTQVIGSGIEAGKRVVIGEGGPDDAGEAQDDKPSNPFLPKFHKSNKKTSGGPPH